MTLETMADFLTITVRPFVWGFLTGIACLVLAYFLDFVYFIITRRDWELDTLYHAYLERMGWETYIEDPETHLQIDDPEMRPGYGTMRPRRSSISWDSDSTISWESDSPVSEASGPTISLEIPSPREAPARRPLSDSPIPDYPPTIREFLSGRRPLYESPNSTNPPSALTLRELLAGRSLEEARLRWSVVHERDFTDPLRIAVAELKLMLAFIEEEELHEEMIRVIRQAEAFLEDERQQEEQEEDIY